MSHANCPVCQKPFAEGDDIVTCPACGAPYHRACYAKTGHCLYQDQHGTGFEYAPAPGAKPAGGAVPGQPNAARQGAGGVLCQHCNTVNDAENIFCESCGEPLHASAPARPAPGAPPPRAAGGAAGQYARAVGQNGPAPGTKIDDIPVRDWMAYIGPNAVQYLQRISFLQLSGRKVSFMISAFFLSPFYFAYRKRWGWAALALGLTLVLSLPVLLWRAGTQGVFLLPIEPQTLDIIYTVSTYLSLAMQVLFGIFALQLYRASAAKNIHHLRAQHTQDTDYYSALARQGGVSVVGVVVVVALVFLFSTLITLWGGEAFATAIAQYYLGPLM